MRKQRYSRISYMICPKCGTQNPVPRMSSMPREKGHVKDLTCAVCSATSPCKEIRYDEFYKTMSGDTVESLYGKPDKKKEREIYEYFRIFSMGSIWSFGD